MTHADLVNRAIRWLRAAHKVEVSLAEPVTVTDERPDVIGWTSLTSYDRARIAPIKAVHGLPFQWAIASHVVECKASRADFLADRKKPHRAADGMGSFRWFFTVPGVVDHRAQDVDLLREMPPGWGLVEVHGRVCRVVRMAEQQTLSTLAHEKERALLVSAARRCIHDWASTKAIGDVRCPPAETGT